MMMMMTDVLKGC